ISASRSKIGFSASGTGRLTAEEFGKRRYDEAVRFFRTDGHAQRIRQLVGLEPPQHEAALDEKIVCFLRSLPFLSREVDENEITDARRHPEAKSLQLFGEPRQPALVMRDRALHMRGIRQ